MSTSKRKQRASKERKAAAAVAQEEAARRRRRLLVIGGIAAVVLLVALVAAVAALTSGDTSTPEAAPDTDTGFAYGTAPAAPPTPPTPPALSFADSGGFESCLASGTVYTATFDTTAGAIVVQLDAEQSPGTVNNFVQLAGWGYYNNTSLFRTDPSIGIIQGGSPHSNDASDEGPGFTIPDEGSGFTYQPGQLVMARTAAANSASAQFFFTVDQNASNLDDAGTYVVFGTVTQGMDVLEKILASSVQGTAGLGGSPDPPVIISSVIIGEATLAGASTSTSTTGATTTSSTAASSTTAPTAATRDTVPPG